MHACVCVCIARHGTESDAAAAKKAQELDVVMPLFTPSFKISKDGGGPSKSSTDNNNSNNGGSGNNKSGGAARNHKRNAVVPLGADTTIDIAPDNRDDVLANSDQDISKVRTHARTRHLCVCVCVSVCVCVCLCVCV